MQGCLDDCPPADTAMDSISRQRPTDLTDTQWDAVQPLMPTPKSGGRPRTVDLRAVLNAIRYVNAGHCSWRRLPDDLPRWGTVHSYYWIWRSDGTWKRIEAAIESAQPEPPSVTG
jgi:putative transposase